jgi:hypothetical protein
MATATEWVPVSDDLWNSLFSSKPESCRDHRCWVDQCPPGSHDEADAAGEA